MEVLIVILILLGTCGDEEEPCDDAACDVGTGGTGGAGGWEPSTSSSTTSATSTTSTSSSATTTGSGGDAVGGGAATSASASTSTSTGGTGPELPTCSGDAACAIRTPGCTAPFCAECLSGRCVSGRCEVQPINEDERCLVTDETSARHGMDGWCQSGGCADYVPVRCETEFGVFTGCDGQEHVNFTITWGETPHEGRCAGSPLDAGRCEPGAACRVVYYDPETGSNRSVPGTCR